MFCKFCGSNLEDGANFCTNCGKVVVGESYDNGVETVGEVSNSYDTVDDEQKSKSGKDVLKFAILGLAFGSSFYLSFLGLIFSIISKRKLKNYKSQFGDTSGAATVGKHLGTAGLILSIVFTAILVLYVLMFAFIILLENGGSFDPSILF